MWRFGEFCCVEWLHATSVSTVVFFSASPALSGFRVFLMSGDATGSRLTRALHLTSCRGCWRRAPLHVLRARVCAWAACCSALDHFFLSFFSKQKPLPSCCSCWQAARCQQSQKRLIFTSLSQMICQKWCSYNSPASLLGLFSDCLPLAWNKIELVVVTTKLWFWATV